MVRHKGWSPDLIVYHIYPRSFADSNGDGIGDLKGITQKLDYLRGKPDSLGINAIWLSPFYPSPMADFGYDIADYCDVDPIFGNIADFKQLLEEAHKRDIKVMVDLVPNHTSMQHPWFKESRSSLDNPKRDWYIWRDAKPTGELPNNWLSTFGGSVWEFDAQTNQYYLHSFLKQQPDLNWYNPEVRAAMQEVVRFWLALGVDGFRVDAVYWLGKDRELRDDQPYTDAAPKKHGGPFAAFDHQHSLGLPVLYDWLEELTNNVLVDYPDTVILAEISPPKKYALLEYLDFYNHVNTKVWAPFNFELLYFPWDASTIKHYVDRFEAALEPSNVPVYVMANHDTPRLATRYGKAAVPGAALLSLTLPGVPVLYYGSELGLENVPIAAADSQDPVTAGARDGERTPMQWDDTSHAGFSTHNPWLPVAENYKTMNVASLRNDPHSIWNLYAKLIQLRETSQTLQSGAYRPLDLPIHVYGFQRYTEIETVTVVINFTDTAQSLPHLHGTVLLSTYLDQDKTAIEEISLRPYEGIILQEHSAVRL